MLLVGDFAYFLWRIDFYDYVTTIRNGSSFIADNYVDPKEVNISFPDKKRNLIYIYLESMEVSYADTANGGHFDFNIIPEMTELAKEGENFSGNTNLLNVGYSFPGTDWTVGGVIAQTSGLPLQVNAKGTSFENGYFESVMTLGDILADNGYRQYFMCGSDAGFAGKADYLKAHGNYDIEDYSYAVQRGWFDDSQRDDWGYNDKHLYEYAKERLLEISKEDGPFNFTMLTVDTHFAGKTCDFCRYEFDELTENIYACANRQVTDFINWLRQQDFYDNTTVVLCGDHTTMDSNISSIIGDEYNRRTYTLYLNTPATASEPDRYREYSTLDQFPTTLAALGAEIEGKRLGLGTNLFSSEDTRTERVGAETERTERNRYSEFLTKLTGVEAGEADAAEPDSRR